MTTASAASSTVEPPSSSWRRETLFLGLLVLGIWAELLFKLRIDWSTNVQYEFGPFVPVFIAFLVWQRWKDRPQPEPFSATAIIVAAGALLLLLLLPIRLIQEANPDWRPLNWVHATVVVMLTLLLTLFLGGWRWLRHFAPPLVLIFFALPWPLVTEQAVIQSMARGVTAVVTELLNWSGVPALQNGNVIHVPTGPVGVEDACSGVRSLAGTLMTAVFFGEFYRLGWFRRIVLLGGGIVVAFVLNLVRSFFLAWIAAKQGADAIPKWHDQVGLMIFCAAFAILWLSGEALSAPRAASRPSAAPSTTLGAIRLPVLIGIGLWLVVVEVGREAWYRVRERELPHYASWNPVWPVDDAGFRFDKVSDEARAILRYSEGRAALFEESGAPRWQMFFFRWQAGRSSSQLAVLHRPDICLPAAGLKCISNGHQATIQVGDLAIPFEGFVFESNGGLLHVFRTLCEDRRPPGTSSGFDQSVSGRLQSAWYGRRNLGQKLLQIGIQGAENKEVALADMQARLPQFLRIAP